MNALPSRPTALDLYRALQGPLDPRTVRRLEEQSPPRKNMECIYVAPAKTGPDLVPTVVQARFQREGKSAVLEFLDENGRIKTVTMKLAELARLFDGSPTTATFDNGVFEARKRGATHSVDVEGSQLVPWVQIARDLEGLNPLSEEHPERLQRTVEEAQARRAFLETTPSGASPPLY